MIPDADEISTDIGLATGARIPIGDPAGRTLDSFGVASHRDEDSHDHRRGSKRQQRQLRLLAPRPVPPNGVQLAGNALAWNHAYRLTSATVVTFGPVRF